MIAGLVVWMEVFLIDSKNLDTLPPVCGAVLGGFRRCSLAGGSTSLGASFESFSSLPYFQSLSASYVCLKMSLSRFLLQPTPPLCLPCRCDPYPRNHTLQWTLPSISCLSHGVLPQQQISNEHRGNVWRRLFTSQQISKRGHPASFQRSAPTNLLLVASTTT